jgi:hypothetical protein
MLVYWSQVIEDEMDEPDKALVTLHEPDADAIKTVAAGDTMYTSAKTFEDLPIPKPLLQG